MAQTFSNWDNVPPNIQAKINKMWSGCGSATFDYGYDANQDKVIVYKLANYKVSENIDFLTNEQKIRFFELAVETKIILSDFFECLSFEPECIRVKEEIYHIPGIIMGTWPHCKLFGGMDETGYIHT